MRAPERDATMFLALHADEGGCCISRRALVGSLAGAAWLWTAQAVGRPQGTTAAAAVSREVKLAFCGQLLCVVPYEVARARGFFEAEGLRVELIYTRGGTAAMQALVGGAVDYAATSFDVALQAHVRGAGIVRFATTGRLPLFALATSPGAADRIRRVEDLVGRQVGVSAVGNADHVLVQYLLARAGVDARRVEFAALGTNLFEAVRVGHVEAGMVQEPALSLLAEAGGRVLVNFMDLEQATRHVGGAYEFMGVAVRRSEQPARLEQMAALVRALERALRFIHQAPAAESLQALPRELVAGGDVARLEAVLERYRRSLYPETARPDLAASERVVRSQQVAGLLAEGVRWQELLETPLWGDGLAAA